MSRAGWDSDHTERDQYGAAEVAEQSEEPQKAPDLGELGLSPSCLHPPPNPGGGKCVHLP